MPDKIVIALISATLGGLLVAIVNHLFTRKKTEAEADKLRAEAEKMRAEANKVIVETKNLEAHQDIDMAKSSMCQAIMEAEGEVYLGGNSLHYFFNDPRLSALLSKAYGQKPRLKFRILLLDYLSEVAIKKASKESSIQQHDLSDEEYKESELYRDIQKTYLYIKSNFPDMEVRFHKDEISFILITDKKAFVKPYLYGVLQIKDLDPILELQKQEHESSYEQIIEHFNSAWNNSRTD